MRWSHGLLFACCLNVHASTKGQHVLQTEPLVSITSFTLSQLISSLDVLQSSFFSIEYGIYPTAIDWTSAVTQTHLTSSLHSLQRANDTDLVTRYYTHLISFYQEQDIWSLRYQANDDKSWVCLGWLSAIRLLRSLPSYYDDWLAPFATRAFDFYELTLGGWDESTCGGGMIWNPKLSPYKNAITNQLYIAASIGMYLYHPLSSPFYLHNAQKAYAWLRSSNMTNSQGLYVDGFHIGAATGKCDERTEDVWTYNQGVILSALSGLYEATNEEIYLTDAQDLITAVIHSDSVKDGVLEEMCDVNGDCSQDGQTFKGIFWYHLSVFCRQHPKRCTDYHEFITRNAEAAWRSRDGDGIFGGWWGSRNEAVNAVVRRSKAAGGKQGWLDYEEWNRDRDASDPNERGRGRTLETHTGGLAVIRAAWEVVTLYEK